MRRLADSNMVGVLLRPNYLDGRNLGDRAYDIVFEALAELGLPVAVHEGLGLASATMGSERFGSFALRHACSHPMEAMAALASLLFGGTFDRFPTLRVGFFESGAGWVPYWLDRLMTHAELSSESSTACRTFLEVFQDQCFVSVDPDEANLGSTVGYLGSRCLGFASDFPHPDCRFPHAVSTFLDNAQMLSSNDLRNCLGASAIHFFGLTSQTLGLARPYGDDGGQKQHVSYENLEASGTDPASLISAVGVQSRRFLSPEWFEAVQTFTRLVLPGLASLRTGPVTQFPSQAYQWGTLRISSPLFGGWS